MQGLLAAGLAGLVSAGPAVFTASTARAQGMGGMGAPPAGGQAKAPSGDILPEVDERIANDPQKVFAHAEQAYKERDWLEAIAYYQHLRQKFSFNTPLVTVADLRLADIAFAREKWSEARGYYRNFLRFHPKAEQADYAAFQIGMCEFNEVPSDSFLTPPSDEKDQSDVKAALQQMRDFVRSFPQSTYVPKAREVIATCEDKLAAHELYVAQFYAHREKWRGVLLRSEALVKSFPESRLVPKAMLLALKAHVALGQGDQARQVYEALAQRQPADKGVLSEAAAALKKAK